MPSFLPIFIPGDQIQSNAAHRIGAGIAIIIESRKASLLALFAHEEQKAVELYGALRPESIGLKTMPDAISLAHAEAGQSIAQREPRPLAIMAFTPVQLIDNVHPATVEPVIHVAGEARALPAGVERRGNAVPDAIVLLQAGETNLCGFDFRWR
jgi:hypothetical protein